MNWTDERVGRLKMLWADGLSASAIASQLREVTRNAVIGKVHRLNLPGREKVVPIPSRKRELRPAHPRPKVRVALAHYIPPKKVFKIGRVLKGTPAPKKSKEEEILNPPKSRKVPLMALNEQMCKWPSGEPGKKGFHFCGHRNFNSLPYCEYHARRAYQEVSARKKGRTERMY